MEQNDATALHNDLTTSKRNIPISLEVSGIKRPYKKRLLLAFIPVIAIAAVSTTAFVIHKNAPVTKKESPLPVVIKKTPEQPKTISAADKEANRQKVEESLRKMDQFPSQAILKQEYRGVAIYESVERKITNEELETLKQILDEIPTQFIEKVKPKGILTLSKKEEASLYQIPVLSPAASSGLQIYLHEGIFNNILGVNRSKEFDFNWQNAVGLIIHEFVHVAQFRDLKNKGAENIKFSTSTFMLLTQADVVESYAQAAGWKNIGGGWHLETTPTSDYARKSPYEDQAEAVKEYLTGHYELLDKPRLEWVKGWLGLDYTEFSQCKIPDYVNFGSSLKPGRTGFSANPIISNKAKDFKSAFQHLSYASGWRIRTKLERRDDLPSLDSVAKYYEDSFPKRGFGGSFHNEGGNIVGNWSCKENKQVYMVITTREEGKDVVLDIMVLSGTNI